MNDPQTKVVLRALYEQIEEVRKHFQQIRSEAAGIASTSNMPDATLHLHDVLQSTEEAATVILDSATEISKLLDNDAIPAAVRELFSAPLGRIYEACSFQDISGQRIKKVLTHLGELESKLQRLSETAKNQAAPAKKSDPLMQGPQLAAVAPSQSEIDKLFGS